MCWGVTYPWHQKRLFPLEKSVAHFVLFCFSAIKFSGFQDCFFTLVSGFFPLTLHLMLLLNTIHTGFTESHLFQ